MKILVTGGSGFLGRYIKNACDALKHEFINFDSAAGKDILYRDGFMTDCMAQKPDLVIHAAAVADLYESDKNLDQNFMVNVMGTYFVARICSMLNIPMIYISTCCTYGNAGERDTILCENDMPVPTETYAWSKLAGESVLGCSGKLRGAILRLGTFYGPGMRPALFNYAAIDKVYREETIAVHGDGDQTRRYIHVADVADAILAVAEKIHAGAEWPRGNAALPVLNVIGDEEISVNDTIAIVREYLEKPAVIAKAPQRDGQILRQKIMGYRIYAYTGWKPKIKYADGMRGCVDWYLKEVMPDAA